MIAGTTQHLRTPSLIKFANEYSLHQRLGLNFDDLAQRPVQEVNDYLMVLHLLDEDDARKAKQAEAKARQQARGRR